MKAIIRRYPLVFVIAVALLARIPAVIFSQGYIHSDDHFDTVSVSYDWAGNGLWGEDGHLRWKNEPSHTIARFPLYTLMLYGIMKVYNFAGIDSLNLMMYGIRAVHALLSLIPVWAAFVILRMVSGRTSWAIAGGLVIGFHFAMPFLGVRNLIEMVGGNIFAATWVFLYRHEYDRRRPFDLYLAGIIAGISWMIRFQLALAIAPIPLILWYRYRDIRPALCFTVGVAAMILVAGLVDLLLLGRFAASTMKLLTNVSPQGLMYTTIPLLYPLEILIFLVPPISFLIVGLIFWPPFIKKHSAIFFSFVVFVVAHMFLANQQERFVLAVIPICIIAGLLAAYEKQSRDGYLLRKPILIKSLAVTAFVINAVLLIPLTVSSGHWGQIAPLLWMEKMEPRPRIILFQPAIRQWMPMDYAGFSDFDRATIRRWEDMEINRLEAWKDTAWDYCLVYPPTADDLREYVDSAQAVFGPMEPAGHLAPSFYDKLIHTVNPRHNPSYEVWIYRPGRRSSFLPSGDIGVDAAELTGRPALPLNR